MPASGVDTPVPNPGATASAMHVAVIAGFGHFDCAKHYRNEATVGRAFRVALVARGVRRKGGVIATKL